MKTTFCNKDLSYSQRRQMLYKRKHSFLLFIRDTLERRIASVNASITTLEAQIKRNQSDDDENKSIN